MDYKKKKGGSHAFGGGMSPYMGTPQGTPYGMTGPYDWSASLPYPGTYSGTYPPTAAGPTAVSPAQPTAAGFPFREESYIENILRLNLGKTATVYMTFEGDQREVFKGVVEAAGRDHIILRDPNTGKRYILLMVYLDYITFQEELNYFYPAPGAGTTRSGCS